MNTQRAKLVAATTCAILLLVLNAGCCSTIQVASFDRSCLEETIRSGRKVDAFYSTLLATKQERRRYSDFSSRYAEIESDMRSLVTRNTVRPHNEESTRIAQIACDEWIKCKANHQSSDNYTDEVAVLHRDRFARIFQSAEEAEKAKRSGTEDFKP